MAQILTAGDYTVLPPVPPSPPVVVTKTIYAGLQLGSFEVLWGVGRSKPVNNPAIHGTLTQTPGAPAVYNYHPVVLGTDRDNVYCLRRLVAQVDLSLLSKATKFTQSAWIKIDNPANCQAFEFDLPTPFHQGTMGIQLLQGSPSWSIRAFDYTIKTWRPLAGTNFPASLLQNGAVFGAMYTYDGVTVTHTGVLLNNNEIPVTYTQSCGAKLANPKFDTSFQLDAMPSAPPYTVTLDKFQVSFE